MIINNNNVFNNNYGIVCDKCNNSYGSVFHNAFINKKVSCGYKLYFIYACERSIFMQEYIMGRRLLLILI